MSSDSERERKTEFTTAEKTFKELECTSAVFKATSRTVNRNVLKIQTEMNRYFINPKGNSSEIY